MQHNARPFDAPLAGRMVGSDLIGRALTGINVAPVEGLVGRSEANQILSKVSEILVFRHFSRFLCKIFFKRKTMSVGRQRRFETQLSDGDAVWDS